MNQKIIILGGRSGTSLLRACIKEVMGLKTWGKYEAPIAEEIRMKWNGLQKWDGMKSQFWNYDWDLTKLPEFDFIIEELYLRFHPKFIILHRPIEERVESHIKLEWEEITSQIIRENPKFKYAIDSYIDNKNTPSYCWFKIMDIWREKSIRDLFDQGNIVELKRVHFKEFMDNYEKTLLEVFDWLGHSLTYDEFQRCVELRKIKHSTPSSTRNTWINEEWKKEGIF